MRDCKKGIWGRWIAWAANLFWKIAKLKEGNHSQIPTLRIEYFVITADTDKAVCLNNVFSSNFNTASYGITETNIGDFAVAPSIEPSEEICTEDVLHFLLTLDTNKAKASGPDGISSDLLKCLKILLNPSIPLSHIF